jgi:hypothetical protein
VGLQEAFNLSGANGRITCFAANLGNTKAQRHPILFQKGDWPFESRGAKIMLPRAGME